jgi:hypothetical protein
MANEFIARNGLIAQNNSTITGSLNVTAGVTGSFTGSFTGNGSGLTGVPTVNVTPSTNLFNYYNFI